jgi:YfiH family protein
VYQPAGSVGISRGIPPFDAIGAIRYAFTTRKSGLGGRTNGLKQPDDWDRVADEFGITPDRLITVHQVHGETVLAVDEGNCAAMRARQADALITREPGLAIGVETADCVPVLLVDLLTPAVAAVHAGWRSTVQKIVQKAAAAMHTEFGSDPSRIIAAIGPAIGPECYEVDEPVMGPVRETFPFWREAAFSRGGGKWSLDLAKLNWLELVTAGLHEGNVHSLGMCTRCNPDLFYSFRREGRTGRMLSVIMIKALPGKGNTEKLGQD